MPPGSGVVSAAKILRPDTPEPLVPSIIARNDRHMTQDKVWRDDFTDPEAERWWE